MKKWMMMIFSLMLCLPVVAEEKPAIPVEIVAQRAQNQIQVGLSEAIAKAHAEIQALPEQYQTRAEVVRMSDDSYRWIVTVFDLVTLTDGWCMELDATTGAVLTQETAESGFFTHAYANWTAQKGMHELWSIADKQLYDALYAVQPSYGLPMSTDMSAEKALNRALFVLGLTSADGYEVGYGFLTGGEGYNGVWEICLVKDGAAAYRVNLDAVTGEVYYMEPDEAGNG